MMTTQAFDPRPGTHWLLNGMICMVERLAGASKIILQRVDSSQELSFNRNQLARMNLAGKFVPTDAPKVTDLSHLGPFNLDELPKHKRDKVLRRLAYAKDLEGYPRMGPKNPVMARVIAETAKRLGDRKPPSPHTVYRWRRALIASGYDTRVLARDAGAIRRRKSRLPAGVKEYLRTVLEEELGKNKGSTIRGLADKVLHRAAAHFGQTRFKSVTGATMLVTLPSQPDAQ